MKDQLHCRECAEKWTQEVLRKLVTSAFYSGWIHWMETVPLGGTFTVKNALCLICGEDIPDVGKSDDFVVRQGDFLRHRKGSWWTWTKDFLERGCSAAHRRCLLKDLPETAYLWHAKEEPITSHLSHLQQTYGTSQDQQSLGKFHLGNLIVDSEVARFL